MRGVFYFRILTRRIFRVLKRATLRKRHSAWKTAAPSAFSKRCSARSALSREGYLSKSNRKYFAQ
jgi:hypothetical protein